MVVLRQLLLILDRLLQVAIIVEHPTEDSLLDLLIVLLLEEVVMQKMHRAGYKQLTALQTHVECTDRSVSRETNGSRAEQRMTGFAHIERGAIRIDELETAMLITVIQVVLGIAVLFGELARLVLTILFFATGGPEIDKKWLEILFCEIKGGCHLLDELIGKAAVSNECLLRVEVFVESLTNNAVGVDRYAHLLKHCIHVSVQLVLAALSHEDDASTTFLNIATDILQLLRSEWQTRSTKQQEIRFLQSLQR